MKVFLFGAGASAATLGPNNAPVSKDFGRVLAKKLPGWSKQFPFLQSAIRYLSLQQPGVSDQQWSLDSVWNGIDENYKLRRVVRHHELPRVANPDPERQLYKQHPDSSSWESFWTLAGWELKRALTLVYGDLLLPHLVSTEVRSGW